MSIRSLVRVSTAEITEMIVRDGNIVPVPYQYLADISQEQVTTFCWEQGLYQIPTIELMQFLESEIGEKSKAIEIGAGNGCIGRALGITMTDSYMQEREDVKSTYKAMGQPTVRYGKDVVNMGGNESIRHYKPEVVLACWVTNKWEEGMESGNFWGVTEEELLDDGVKKYIHVGNTNTHKMKPILKTNPYEEFKFPWLVSRSQRKEDNVIYIIKP